MTQFMYITWDVSPVIFKIGGFELRWYGLLFAAGFVLGYQILARIFKLEKQKEEALDSLLLTMIISTVLGARIGHYVFYEGYRFADAPIQFIIDMLVPPYAGLASHGASIGILIGLYIYTKKQKATYLWVTDRVVIAAALGGASIRFGNLMNSEIVGKATDVSWAFLFKQNMEFEQVPRHAAQLYEALSCLILFGILLTLYNKWKEKAPAGALTGLFFTWIFTLRFCYEFLKENQEDFENTMTLNMGQILSIPLVIFGLYLLYRSLLSKKPLTI